MDMPLSIGSSKNLLVVIVRELRTVNISLEGCKDYDHLKAVHIPSASQCRDKEGREIACLPILWTRIHSTADKTNQRHHINVNCDP